MARVDVDDVMAAWIEQMATRSPAPGDGPATGRGNGVGASKAETPDLDIVVHDAADDPEPDQLPPRGWLLGNQFCKEFVSGIVSQGAGGKTSLRIAQYLSGACGRPLTGQHVFFAFRTLVLSLEDSRKEYQKRLAAARIHHRVGKDEIRGRLFYVTLEELQGAKLAELDPRGQPVRGRLYQALRRIVVEHGIDLLSLDPTIKTHALDENSNKHMDFLVETMALLAIEFNIATDVSAHVRKGTKEGGDADAGRGASAFRDGGRLFYTLTRMTPEEAAQLGVPANERRAYVRLDSSKVNIAPPAEAEWFRLVGVPLGNRGDPRYPNGDEVQTVEPWRPPETFAGVTDAQLNAALDEIDRGLPGGQQYSAAKSARTRAAWPVVQKHCPEKTEQQCRGIIKAWVNSGLLKEETYRDEAQRKDVTGVRVDSTKRPGNHEGG